MLSFLVAKVLVLVVFLLVFGVFYLCVLVGVVAFVYSLLLFVDKDC